MAQVNNFQCYKGERVDFNLGIMPAAMSIGPLAAGQAVLTVAALPGNTNPLNPTYGFADAGTLYVGTVPVAYTGRTATTFTGCSGIVATSQTALVTSSQTDITGWTMLFTLKRYVGDPTPVFTKVPSVVSGPGGQLRVSVTHADTNIKPMQYTYDVWRTDAGFEACLSAGPFTILAEANY